jgi:hypothetical protein
VVSFPRTSQHLKSESLAYAVVGFSDSFMWFGLHFCDDGASGTDPWLLWPRPDRNRLFLQACRLESSGGSLNIICMVKRYRLFPCSLSCRVVQGSLNIRYDVGSPVSCKSSPTFLTSGLWSALVRRLHPLNVTILTLSSVQPQSAGPAA